jgi:hypothetical protein
MSRENFLAQNEAYSDSLKQVLVQPKKRASLISPPSINPTPIYSASYNLGFATAQEGDDYSFDRVDLGRTVVSGIGITQEELGQKAQNALSHGVKQIKEYQAKVRAHVNALPRWVMYLIMVASVLIDAVAAHTALSILWDASDLITWLTATAIAAMFAIMGWIIALTSVKLLGKSSLWIGLLLAFTAILALGLTTAQLRGTTMTQDSLESQFSAIEDKKSTFVLGILDPSNPTVAQQQTIDNYESELQVATELIQINEAENSKVSVLFFGALLLFTVSIAWLSKAYEANQGEEQFDKRTAGRQLQRGNDLAKAYEIVERLRAWIPLGDAVAEVGKLSLSHFVDGYRAGLTANQLDQFSNNPPSLAEFSPAIWPEGFKLRLDALEKELNSFDDQLSLPETRG